MRTFVFTLLAITAGTAIQYVLVHLPYSVDEAMHGIDGVLMFVLPVIVTAGLARAMRIWNWYVFFLAILSPFVAAILGILFSVGVLNEPFYV